jgi:hypothetical protein
MPKHNKIKFLQRIWTIESFLFGFDSCTFGMDLYFTDHTPNNFFYFIFLALSALGANCKCFTGPAGLPFFDRNWFLYKEVAKTVTVGAFLMRDLAQSFVLGICDISAAFRTYFSSHRLLQDYVVKYWTGLSSDRTRVCDQQFHSHIWYLFS